MKETGQIESVLLVGNSKLIISIASCLKNAGTQFSVHTQELEDADNNQVNKTGLAILVTDEDLFVKKNWIRKLEDILDRNSIIAVNTETIGLDLLQEGARFPDRIIGANWVEPADTTSFLEIIANDTTDSSSVKHLSHIATLFWGKDPYVIQGNTGIRMPLMGALIREAFYLVENGYATVEDIDRACRNDAGYYLPFAGNLRYMDLMGTNAYGMVMKDLNAELSKDEVAPDFFQQMMASNDLGMETEKGFYQYQFGEAEKWQQLLHKFSYEVRELIEKYPFNTVPEETVDHFQDGSTFR